MRLIDTHAHLHDPVFAGDPKAAIVDAKAFGVEKIILIGTDAELSEEAIKLAQKHHNVWATVGLHPHEAEQSKQLQSMKQLLKEDKVVAVGEIGLDYYRLKSPKAKQKQVFERQLKWAKSAKLPVSLHIRDSEENPGDAFDDVWKIWDRIGLTKAVVHSFSAGVKQMDQVVERGLYLGLNGIMTFSKDPEHALVAREAPLENIVLETDAPYLTPEPFRGTINEPKFVEHTAAFLAAAHGVTKEKFASVTSDNAEKLFSI